MEPQPQTIKTLRELEREYILETLKRLDNNKAKTAAQLGITLRTLYNKLHDYGWFKENGYEHPWSARQ